MADYGLCGKMVALPRTRGHSGWSSSRLSGGPRWRTWVSAVRREPQPGDADAVWAMEVWESVEALTELPGAEAVQKLIARARPVIVGMGERFELSASAERGWAARRISLSSIHS